MSVRIDVGRSEPVAQSAVKCCNGGEYAGHDYWCDQPDYAGPPPLPGHSFCFHGNQGGNYCWRHCTSRRQTRRRP